MNEIYKMNEMKTLLENKIITAVITFENDVMYSFVLPQNHTEKDRIQFLEEINELNLPLAYHGCNYLVDNTMVRVSCYIQLKEELWYHTKCGWKCIYFPMEKYLLHDVY